MTRYESYERRLRRRQQLREAVGWAFIVLFVIVHDAIAFLVFRALFGV